jgi:hypothetical protein
VAYAQELVLADMGIFLRTRTDGTLKSKLMIRDKDPERTRNARVLMSKPNLLQYTVERWLAFGEILLSTGAGGRKEGILV